jgi:hypothetical protein
VFEPGARLGQVPTRDPEPIERAGQPKAKLVVVLGTPLEDRAEVAVLDGQRVERRGHAGPAQGALHVLGQLDVIAGVALTRDEQLAVLDEAVERVGADRVEQPEPLGVGAMVSRAHEALGNELGQREQRVLALPLAVLHGVDRGQAETAREHAALAEQRLLRGREQVVAPRNRGLQRAVALRQIARAAADQRRAGAEPLQDAARGQDGRLRSRQLDGERQAVQSDADFGDGDQSVVGHLKVGAAGAGAVVEERD